MPTVATIEDIHNNIDQLNAYRNSQNPDEQAFFRGLIERGICFVVREHDGAFQFAPSRFVGYTANTMLAHQADHGHGGETNAAISDVLGSEPTLDDDLEQQYQQFCHDLGLIPRPQGAFGDTRRYWHLPA